LHLKRELDKLEIKTMISPTPREASASCGISLIVDEVDLPLINQVISENNIQILKIVSLPRKKWQFRGL